MPPFAIDHGLSCRILPRHDPWDVARRVDDHIKKHNRKIRACAVTARCEQSATRKQAWTLFYSTGQAIQGKVGSDKIEQCARSMAI